MNPRDALGLVIRGIGIYFLMEALYDGLLGMLRSLGFQMGASSTWQRDLCFMVASGVAGFAFMASADEIAKLAYPARDLKVGEEPELPAS